MSESWVFGYGSLVDLGSLGRTIGRVPTMGEDALPAVLSGYGRRWNYATARIAATAARPDEPVTVVALGLALAAHEAVNGVIARVSESELAALDERERNYDRVDVTASVTVAADEFSASVVTYVPRAEPIARFEAARSAGHAVISRHYWDLVDAAFAALGPGEQERYRSSTPDPGIPVAELHADFVPPRHHRSG